MPEPASQEPPVPVVVLHVWRVRSPARALLRMGLDRLPLARSGAATWKLLGTAGTGFGLRDGDPHRWALLTCWPDEATATAFERHRVVRGWDALAVERARLVLDPVASVGRWGGVAPFGAPRTEGSTDGPVVAVTRARLRRRTARTFRSAAPPVAAALARAPGLLHAMGVGERPVGLLGTCSLWTDEAALLAFARRDAAHAAAARASRERGWFAEELFARLAVRTAEGVLDGVPLARLTAPRRPAP